MAVVSVCWWLLVGGVSTLVVLTWCVGCGWGGGGCEPVMWGGVVVVVVGAARGRHGREGAGGGAGGEGGGKGKGSERGRWRGLYKENFQF